MIWTRFGTFLLILQKNKADSLLQSHLKVNCILKGLREFLSNLKLAGGPQNALLSVSDALLVYVHSLLREERPLLPQVTVDEWSELFTRLQDHGLVPLLYWKMGHLPSELRPGEFIIGRMREIFLASHARYLTMEGQILEILDAFDREKISVLVLKGAALALTAYPYPATRPFNDIDLLVRSEQYLKARKILNQIGYQCLYKRFEMFQESFNSEPFVRKADTTKPYEVDLHWNIFQYHGLRRNNGVGAFFDRRKTVETPMLTFETLSTVDALIQAAFHLILHHPEGMRLIWVSDIALLAQNLAGPEDWETLRKRTSEFKASLAMEKALKLAHLWYGLRIPEGYKDFANWLRPEEAEKTELTYAIHKQGPDIRLKGYLASVRSAPGKIPYLMKLIFPDPDYVRIAYPPPRKWLLPLSYVRRWGRWFAKLIQYVFYAWSTGPR